MKVRRGTTKDIPEITALGEAFYTQTLYHKSGVEYDNYTVYHMLEYLLSDSGIVVVAEDDKLGIVGFVLVALFPFPFNAAHISATELAFFVRPDQQRSGVGRAMLLQAEKVARQRGVKFFSMISLESVAPEKAKALYEGLGYALNETVYTKEV